MTIRLWLVNSVRFLCRDHQMPLPVCSVALGCDRWHLCKVLIGGVLIRLWESIDGFTCDLKATFSHIASGHGSSGPMGSVSTCPTSAVPRCYTTHTFGPTIQSA